MTFEKGLHAAKTHTTNSWKHILTKHPLLHLLFASLIAGVAGPSTIWAQEQPAPLTTAAASQPSQTTAYHYVVPLSLALEAASESVRVCALHGIRLALQSWTWTDHHK